MAGPEAIIDVREKTNERTGDDWSDEDISALVDSLGNNNLAAAHIWRKKAAQFAELVNVSEAGASQALGELFDRALKQAAYYEREAGVTPPTSSVGPANVHVIRRTS